MRHDDDDSPNPFAVLAGLQWQDTPNVTLHEWRVQIPSTRDGTALQVEYADYRVLRGGARSAIFSVVAGDGARGPEVVVRAAELRRLQVLFQCTDLSPPQPEEASDDQDRQPKGERDA